MGLLVTMVTVDLTACVGVVAGSGACAEAKDWGRLAFGTGTSGGTDGLGFQLPAAAHLM